MTTTQNAYALGASDAELHRLDVQARYYRRATIDGMRWAGIEPGMRVLDIGSGTGAVAIDAARLVGPTGSVLGLDAAEVPLRTATERAARLGLDNVRFVEADLATWETDSTFDALTGRLISMYLPNPSAAIARLTRFLRPGGIVLLQEFSISSARQVPPSTDPLFRLTLDRVLATFRAIGVPTDLGFELGRVLRGAGLEQPTMTLGGQWEDGPDALSYSLLAGVVRTMLPVMVARGIATEAEIDIDTLEARLRTASTGAVGVTASLLVSAWARTPVS